MGTDESNLFTAFFFGPGRSWDIFQAIETVVSFVGLGSVMVCGVSIAGMSVGVCVRKNGMLGKSCMSE